jgi:hypothetical protein
MMGTRQPGVEKSALYRACRAAKPARYKLEVRTLAPVHDNVLGDGECYLVDVRLESGDEFGSVPFMPPGVTRVYCAPNLRRTARVAVKGKVVEPALRNLNDRCAGIRSDPTVT